MPHGDGIIMPKQLPKVNHKLQWEALPLTSRPLPLSCASRETSKLCRLTSVPTFAKELPIAWAGE